MYSKQSDVSLLFDIFDLLYVLFVSVSGEGIAVVCVSRVSAGAPRGAEKDPQLSQHQQQPDKQA